MTRILTRMTSKNVSQPDPALVKLIIRKNLAEFVFRRKRSMEPYLIASGTVSTLNLYQFNQYQANFVQFQTELNAQITQMNP